MAKTRRKSAGTPAKGVNGGQKSRPKEKRRANSKQPNVNLAIKRKCGRRPQKLKADMELALTTLEDGKNNFAANRTFSVTKVKTAKNIQVTCKNDATPTTSRETQKAERKNHNDDEDVANLSLASYGRELIRRKLSFARKLNDKKLVVIDVEDAVTGNTKEESPAVADTPANNNIENNNLENKVDEKPIFASDVVENADNTLIVIDDDSNDVTVTDDVEIVDLTTPYQTPAKSDINHGSEVWTPVVDLTTPQPAETSNFCNPYVWDVPPNQNANHHMQLFPPIPILTQPTVLQSPPQVNQSSSQIFGTNFLNAGGVRTVGLRPIFIDGNNVALGHSNGKYFSVKGLKICIDYFKIRGHEVTAIVPQIRKRVGENSDPKLLNRLEKEGVVVFTPSRVINGRNVIPYDDRFIVQLAAVHQGIIVSCDNYRDLLAENPNLRDTIENRVLNPTFVKDMIIFPSDPLGRYGPKLDDFLRFP